MEYYFLIAGIVLIYLIIVIIGKQDEKNRKKRFIARLKKEYGNMVSVNYSEERTASLSGFFSKHCEENFCLDDITWNDLDMDDVFRMINHCYSSAGEEYLYYRLRSIRLEETQEETENEEEILRFLEENSEERLKLQILFAKMGRTGKFSIYQYLDYLNNVRVKSMLSFYIRWVICLICIVLIFFVPPVGVIGLIVSSIYNILVYLKEKKKIEPYFISFKYILRILKTADALAKNPPEVLKNEVEELKTNRKIMKSVSSANLWWVEDNAGNASGDITLLIINYLKMIFHIDLFVFYMMYRQVMKHSDAIDRMITIMGKLESQISIASFRAYLPKYCLPTFRDEDGMQANNLYHPLLSEPVANSFTIHTHMLLTGSNASGKSTFLKTVAVNAVLAQGIRTVAAENYCAAYYRVYSSMALRDSIQNGESYYMVEIRSLKRIMDAAVEDHNRVLCFVDEVLRGTNTVERIAASTKIMQQLAQANTLCFAATHDIELTQLLAKEYENYHFEEEIVDDDILFNYQLQKGHATTRNAIKLLQLMGYPPQVIESANALAQYFSEHGEWR